MRKPGRIATSSAILAMVMAIIAFVLGSAPFTPAMILAVIALPVAITCLFLGAWRLSVITIYWVLAAFMTMPMARALPFYVDDVLIVLGVGGLALSALIFFGYVRAKTVT